jgi:hypothetical protein
MHKQQDNNSFNTTDNSVNNHQTNFVNNKTRLSTRRIPSVSLYWQVMVEGETHLLVYPRWAGVGALFAGADAAVWVPANTVTCGGDSSRGGTA